MNLGKSYNDSLPTLGQVMAQVIEFFKCQRIYGVGGDFAANLIAALENELDICPSSNEMHAGFSACAQAEIDGLGFCLTTYTVGSLPCTSAAALAITESLPVVFISGAPAETEVNSVAIHHTVHSHSSWKADYDNALNAFEALGMTVERLQGDRVKGHPNIAGKRFYQLVAQAYKTKQPVFIEVPRDQVFCKTQPLKLPSSVQGICCGTKVLTGSEFIVENIINKLKAAKHPVIFIGDRLKHNEQLKRLIVQFAQKLNIPYATTWFSKGLFDEFQALCLGAYNGIFSQTAGSEYIDQTMDYVLDVATSVFAQDCNIAFGTGTHKIEDFDNKTILKGGDLLETDLIEIFTLLLEKELPAFECSYNHKQVIPIASDEDIDFNNLAATLNELQSEDQQPYVYLPEVGNSYFTSYSLKTRLGGVTRGWLTNPWYGAMGTALPYARVVAQRIKDQDNQARAVVIIGDGGFHFQSNELIHFLKDNTDVTIIYMRNNIFHLGKSGNSKIYHCNDLNFDVHALINAYQGHSCTVKSVKAFKAAFKQTLNQSGINLIEVLAKPIEERQCNELKLLNLYIKAQNGRESELKQWQALTAK